LSNLIKGSYIHYSQSDRVIIDSNATDNFSLLSFAKVEEEVIPEEKEKEETEEVEAESLPDLEEVRQYAETIIQDAQAQAEEIVSSAKADAFHIMEEARNQGREEGLQSGIADLEAKRKEMEQELAEKEAKLEEEAKRQAKQLEPQFADLTMKLVEKLTGIIAEDKKDLILYLISTALKPIRGPKKFYIRISKEDAAAVTSKKAELAGLLSQDASLEIIEDATLNKNQCFIETEDRLLDVSLDVQLKNLAEHLKMLANA